MPNYEKPLVSVCMITYNHEDFIEKAITSILEQTGNFDLELIIADDASTDNTINIVKEIIDNHANNDVIKYTKHTVNKGMMPNFLWALNECSGDYIALCDGDDYWVDNKKLDTQIEFLKNNLDYTLCFHPCYFLNKEGEIYPQKLEVINYDYTFKNILEKWGIPTASMVFRTTNVFSNIPKWVNEIQSGDIAIALLNFEEGKFKLMKDHMSVYRLHGDGVSEYHKGSKMIDYRVYLHWNLNKYFKGKYENSIYEALHSLMIKHMPQLDNGKRELTANELLFKLKNKFFKRLR